MWCARLSARPLNAVLAANWGEPVTSRACMEVRNGKVLWGKLCLFNNTVCIICIQEDGGGETGSACVALTSSPEPAHTLQFAAKYHMFSYLVGIKIYIVLRVTWRASGSVPLPLHPPPQQVMRKDLVLK